MSDQKIKKGTFVRVVKVCDVAGTPTFRLSDNSKYESHEFKNCTVQGLIIYGRKFKLSYTRLEVSLK